MRLPMGRTRTLRHCPLVSATTLPRRAANRRNRRGPAKMNREVRPTLDRLRRALSHRGALRGLSRWGARRVPGAAAPMDASNSSA